jgi:hypothetical protein
MILRTTDIIARGLDPALALLPYRMDSLAARILLLTIGLQESRLEHRRQLGNGPARGLLQFEQGGGVKGVMTHHASKDYARKLCDARGVAFKARSVWARLETDDVLAFGFGRLLLWTHPKPLPANEADAWDYYLWLWRPGKPHPETWPAFYRRVTDLLTVRDTEPWTDSL